VEICIFIRAFAWDLTCVIRALLEPGNHCEFTVHSRMKWGASPQLNL